MIYWFNKYAPYLDEAKEECLKRGLKHHDYNDPSQNRWRSDNWSKHDNHVMREHLGYCTLRWIAFLYNKHFGTLVEMADEITHRAHPEIRYYHDTTAEALKVCEECGLECKMIDMRLYASDIITAIGKAVPQYIIIGAPHPAVWDVCHHTYGVMMGQPIEGWNDPVIAMVYDPKYHDRITEILDRGE